MKKNGGRRKGLRERDTGKRSPLEGHAILGLNKRARGEAA